MLLCLQAVFSQTEGLEVDGSTETQYAYYPATIADATAGTMVTTVQASDSLLGQTTPTGDHRGGLKCMTVASQNFVLGAEEMSLNSILHCCNCNNLH